MAKGKGCVSDVCYRILTQTFGHTAYKGKQKEIVEAAASGLDVLVVAPTGMGKSLCFQVPALAAEHGMTIVVSPLLALMKNQVDNLRNKGVPVAAFTSETTKEEKKGIIKDMSSSRPKIRLLYITPEKLLTQEFQSLLDGLFDEEQLNLFVVDEAHCVSEWGYDFRQEYRRLGEFRKKYAGIPIMALTATATEAVQEDIVRSLKMSTDNLFCALHPFNRENLYYQIKYLSAPDDKLKMADVFDYITTLYRRRGRPSSGIIYCRKRVTCDELSSYLRGKGLSARPYHRGIASATLDATLKKWTNGGLGEEGSVDLVIATIAFGLGIDKGDVRYIIHYDVPKSFEGYYQETGRGGRDGLPSKCILYYSREDALYSKRLATNPNVNRVKEDNEGLPPTQRAIDSISALIQFAESGTICRHVSICRYFGEAIDVMDKELVKTFCNRMCDVCKYPNKVQQQILNLSSMEHASSRVDGYITKAQNSDQQAWQKNNQRPQSRNSFGDNKRAGPAQEGNVPKKIKAALPTMLVTKPFGSASGLSKPFKPPSFVQKPQKVAPPELGPEPELEVNALEEMDCNYDIPDIVEDDEDNLHEVFRESSPVTLPDVEMELESAFSNKIPAEKREETFDLIRRALYKIFVIKPNHEELWAMLQQSPSDGDARNNVLFEAARTIEFSVLCLCSTLDGYKRRSHTMMVAIRLLSETDVWHRKDADLEDVREITDVLQRHCLESGKNGMERAS